MRRFRFKKYLRVRTLALLGIAALLLYVAFLDFSIRSQFEGKRWALPARVYASPIELYPGRKISANQLTEELAALNYHPGTLDTPGMYTRERDRIELVSRPFAFWDGAQPALHIAIGFSGKQISEIENLETHQAIPLVRLDPLLIGGIYPAHNEDRVLVKLNEVPPMLIKALIAVEDRKYYEHHGVDPRGIARALWTNVRAAGAVQGGSTLTQQLVKNFYLTSERTFRRKATEAIMALLLDAHYSKDEILEAYVNEIYLGQDGSRAIHGFGLASLYYFDRPLQQLSLSQAALLVGLVKGPSYYDPRRHPDRARTRRNVVLAELAEQHAISSAEYLSAKAAPLDVTSRAPMGTSPYPAFLALVHRQLRSDYSDTDLRSEGLRIFTTLDPRVQRTAEQALAARLTALEKERRIPSGALEGAIVVTSSEHGEVLALVGGRRARFEGFNRAIDAVRPIGSLIKPVVYLTALSQPDKYTLTTRLDDSPLVWKDRGAKEWAPQNYDKQFHGQVELRTALAESYNVSTARLGLALGIPAIIDVAHQLGVERPLAPYGSTLLGAAGLTPLEVAQMYQTIASGGFRTKLRAIREVLAPDGTPLKRYSLAVDQAADPAAVYLTTAALQHVVQAGTATGLSNYLSPDLKVAGKTGTTDDLRDSWFAGFTGDKLAVVWVGRDDNQPTALTGAAGALTVWGQMMAALDPEPLTPSMPERVEVVRIDAKTGLRADRGCSDTVEIPYVRGSAPTETAPCSTRSPVEAVKSWFRRLFER
ncbi:MAG: penicillin-binding protein 1B [Sulfurifustis sp.]